MKKAFSAMLTVFVVVALLLAMSQPANASRVDRAVTITKNQIGDPYSYGAAGPNRFDCSGLVYYSYRKAGIKRVARTSKQQASQTRHISRSHMRKGDLMFFYGSSGVYHVAVFVGWKNNRRLMIHSPRPGQRVHRAVPWTNSWYPGTYR